MYSVYVLRNYVNSEELRDYLERNGFETSIISKITGGYVDERKDQYAIQTFADGYFAAFTYNGDKWPPQRVFKKIRARLAELVDALASGASDRKVVRVQIS